MKKKQLMILIAALTAVLIILVVVAVCVTGQQGPADNPSVPSGSDSSSFPSDTTGNTEGSSEATGGTEESSDPTQSEPEPTETEPEPTETDPEPTETEPQPTETQPDSSGSEYIGSLYTRSELEAMSTTYNPDGYGAGMTSGGKRPGGPVYDQSKYGQYGGNFVGEDEPTIYLTFDCGYEYTATDENGNKYRVTERILDVLKEKNVKAVFFVTMYYCKDQPDLVQRMINEGHAVGNHTNNHPVMPAQSIDKMVYEVTSLHDYVLEKFGYTMTLFRPPTGAFSVQSLSVLKSLGYKTMLWSFQYLDYETDKQPEVTAAYNKVTSAHHNGAIYLLHAISTTNATILGDAIDFFRAEGYNLELFR